MRFSVPYNYDIEIIGSIRSIFGNERIDDFYFPIPCGYMANGRPQRQPDGYAEDIFLVSEAIAKEGFRRNLLLNPGCTGTDLFSEETIDSILGFVQKLASKTGLELVTITNPLFGRRIRDRLPDVEIAVSVNANVNNLTRALDWEECGASVVTLDQDLNKSPGEVRKIKENTNLKIKLLANQWCFSNCGWKQSHQQATAHSTLVSQTDEFNRYCYEKGKAMPHLWYSSCFIAPKNLPYFEDFVDRFKIVGRKYPTGRVLSLIGAYLGHEEYEAERNILDNFIPDGVFEKVIECDRICGECDFCREAYLAYRDTFNTLYEPYRNNEFARKMIFHR